MSGILEKRLDEVIYTVFDFETTGLSYDNGDKVVELAFVKYSFKDGIIDEFSSLVNPQIPIPFDASEVHGIYDSDVKNAPTFASFKDKILSFIDGTILVGHNVYFDLRFLKGEMSELAIEINAPHICTMGFPGFVSGKTRQKLDIICKEKGITLSNAHSALDDTKATVELHKRHIEDAHFNDLFTFGDLKSTKRTYKFISSWKIELPILQYSNDNLEKIQLVHKLNRTKKSSTRTSYNNQPSYNSSSNTSEGCYIATAVYGSYEAPEVLILRKFRDTVLKRHLLGKVLISSYYFVSPSIAKKLKGKGRVNNAIKQILDEFVRVIG